MYLLAICMTFPFFKRPVFLHVTLFIFLFLAVLSLCCCVGLSLVAGSSTSSLIVACGLLIAVASLVAEQGP